MHRFFIETGLDFTHHKSIITSDHYHQIIHVLRGKVGDEFEFFSQQKKRYRVKLIRVDHKKKELEVEYVRFIEEVIHEQRRVRVFFSPLREKMMSFAIQKATEIGVSEFVPILCDRTQHKIYSLVRYQEIIREAVEQSGRVDFPLITETVKLERALLQSKNPLILDMTGDSKLSQSFGDIDVFIGPEGGWSQRERALFQDMNVFSLSKATLRAETAVVAISSILMLG